MGGGWLSEINAHWTTGALTHVLVRAHARAHATSEHRLELPKPDSFRSVPVCCQSQHPLPYYLLRMFLQIGLFTPKCTFYSKGDLYVIPANGKRHYLCYFSGENNVMKIKQHRHLQCVVEQVGAARSRLSDCIGDRRVISWYGVTREPNLLPCGSKLSREHTSTSKGQGGASTWNQNGADRLVTTSQAPALPVVAACSYQPCPTPGNWSLGISPHCPCSKPSSLDE